MGCRPIHILHAPVYEIFRGPYLRGAKSTTITVGSCVYVVSITKFLYGRIREIARNDWITLSMAWVFRLRQNWLAKPDENKGNEKLQMDAFHYYFLVPLINRRHFFLIDRSGNIYILNQIIYWNAGKGNN
jgi:hypothetical protein